MDVSGELVPPSGELVGPSGEFIGFSGELGLGGELVGMSGELGPSAQPVLPEGERAWGEQAGGHRGGQERAKPRAYQRQQSVRRAAAAGLMDKASTGGGSVDSSGQHGQIHLRRKGRVRKGTERGGGRGEGDWGG